MLQIELPGVELFNDATQEFVTTKPRVISLEHSLLSISKWEARWKKSFFSLDRKTWEETIDYIKCMTITQNVPHADYLGISSDIVRKINDYIDDPMTATTFKDTGRVRSRSGEETTSELVYYWMIIYNIPFECQKWHFNRLMTLIQVCNIKEGPQRKMSQRDSLAQQRSLNAMRRQRLNTRG